jgi:uncharacterized repeat protein (TIGR01451 family)
VRAAKTSIVVVAVAGLALSTIAIAGALITGASGQVIWLTAPPASVAVNAKEDATSAFAFDERQNVTLSSAVAVDAVDPGAYTMLPTGSSTIPAGTQVDSHLIHNDLPTGATARHNGSVSFPSDIIGVIAATNHLAASDRTLGAPGTTYAGSRQYRGLEMNASGTLDKFTISADRRTLSFVLNTSTVIDDLRVVTRHVDSLSVAISDAPDPVTAGNDVLYTLVVTNTGYSTVADAHVVDTFSSAATFTSATAANGCTGTVVVDCALGAIPPGSTGIAKVVVTSPSTVPEGGTIQDTAIGSPGENFATTEVTTVETPESGVSKGYVAPGGSIDTTGDQPALLTLPPTGDGAAVLITQGPGTFCDGLCAGPATTIGEFAGYDDPNHPIHLMLTYTFPDSPTSLTDAVTSFNGRIYKNDDPDHPDVGVPVPACTTPGSGVAVPHPCVDGHTITQPSPNSFVVTFDVLYLSGDPKFALR